MKTSEITTGRQTREIAAAWQETAETREIVGIGVPYDIETEIYPGLRESFAPGSVDATGALLFYGHREPIGKILETRDTPEGLQLKARISETNRGNEVYTLLKDGVLTKMSIGFEPIGDAPCQVTKEKDTEIIRWNSVKAREFSIVPFPAYQDATITKVRQENRKETKMDTTTTDTLTRADLEPINDTLDRLEREIAKTAIHAEAPAPQWRSMGELLKDIAAGDETALSFHERAFSGQTTADTIMKNSFVGKFIHLAFDRRRVTSIFTTGVLPKDGLSVDYYQVETTDFKMAKQSKEGADLTGVSKLTLKDKNAPVSTIGGWTEITRQAVERATVPLLDTLLHGMALKYAQVTDGLVREILTNQLSQATNKIALGADPSAGTVKQWTDTLIEAADLYGATMFEISGLGVSKDVFKALANLETQGNRLMDTGQGRNLTGSIDVQGLSGNLLRIPVRLIPGASANTAFFYDKQAIKTLESAGSPAMLQDSNIINLSQSYSLYGYHAVIVPFPAAIVPVVKTVG